MRKQAPQSIAGLKSPCIGNGRKTRSDSTQDAFITVPRHMGVKERNDVMAAHIRPSSRTLRLGR
jgi:hypothetical protein